MSSVQKSDVAGLQLLRIVTLRVRGFYLFIFSSAGVGGPISNGVLLDS